MAKKDAVASADVPTASAGFGDNPSSESSPINPEEIAALAYTLWQARGCPEGSPEIDWLQAEQQLRDRNETADRPKLAEPLIRASGA